MNENKMSDKDKQELQELRAFRALLIQLGFHYYMEGAQEEYQKALIELPEVKEAIKKHRRELEELKELRRKLKESKKLIIEEAKKRKCGVSELIDYFLDHREELLELLEKKIIKTLPPKFSKIYTHSEIGNLMHKIFKTQKLNDEGISTIEEDFITGEVKIWESKGIQYIVKVDDLPKLEGKNPKVYVSQIKNISLLMGLIQEQQYNNNSTKEAKCEFSLSYYAERRGYKKEEIQQGGYFKELKRDLLTGAYTTYRLDNVIIEGKKYIRHGIPNFYILDEPKDRENKWIVTLNNPYSDWITKILNGEAGKYSITNPKAIEDRITTEKPYLFLFYMQLIKRKRANLLTMPVKIGNLLKDMKIDEQILARPKECFKLFRECLIYFNENYKPIPEIESFNLYNDFHKTKTVKLPLHISEAFKQYGYEDFKGLVKAIGIKDIREAYISFKRPYTKPKTKFILTEVHKELIKEILEWAKEWEEYQEGHEIPFTEEERYKFLSDCTRYLGYEKLEASFIQEKTREHSDVFNEPYHCDDPIGYFTKRLPELLKEDKEAKATSKSFQQSNLKKQKVT